ncbi:MAG: TraR/DksA C4-type zinc finger protein [Acinetobacter sp.]|uniref:TraR/DksA C4-type zinc finger protein n=1 Tax=Acinetobacter sp. TaxID=472 RepID=UPI00260A598D|nr:TraR/DksA C4-type zinc finger protein [Acinetobacter sp.]MDD2944937.1 TraR/DksA C4-type zinc finger protein [Acinetobacter sp.]
MADDIDVANDNIELAIKSRLSTLEKFDKPSLSKCKECGEDIPIERQKLGNVTLCIDCKNTFENRR